MLIEYSEKIYEMVLQMVKTGRWS